MMTDDMTTSSNGMKSLGDAIKARLTEVDERCPEHGCKLITAFGREPLCMECGQADKEKREREMIEKVSADYFKHNTYNWLGQHSIFLDDTLKQSTFENYETIESETVTNKELALDIARDYYKGETYNSLLTGLPGTGKSHLAMSMLRVVNEHSQPYKKCLFIAVDELMRRIKGSFSKKDSYYTEERMVSLLTEADLLVLDDLGAETGAITSDKTATDFTTKVLYAIVNGRMSKPTIITTNLNSREMARTYDSKLISRMLKGAQGHVITFKNTPDRRMDFDF